MSSEAKHKWTFLSPFRRHSFGWRSQPAFKRIKEAFSEIKKVARKDSILRGEGAVLFIERLSTAIEQIDSSSGSIGNAVNTAISALVPIIANAQIDDALRNKWMERLCKAVEEDNIP